MWTLLPRLPSLTFCISSSLHPTDLSGWTACSSPMLLVLGQRSGFFYTPTTPFFFYQARIPAAINQSGDSPWMSVNMFPSLPPFPLYFSLHTPCWEIVVVGHQIFRAGCRLSQVESKSFGSILHIHEVIKTCRKSLERGGKTWKVTEQNVHDTQAGRSD